MPGMKVRRIDHVAIAVPDLTDALAFFADTLGLSVSHTDVEEAQGVVVAFLPAGESELELVEPVAPESGVTRFLDRRGPGVHHICFEVDDLDSALDHLRARQVELIDPVPHVGTGGRRIAFIHPRSAHGVLVELYETLPGDHGGRRLQNVDTLRRRILRQGRVAAAGTRGFLGSLRRNGASAAPAPAPDRPARPDTGQGDDA